MVAASGRKRVETGEGRNGGGGRRRSGNARERLRRLAAQLVANAVAWRDFSGEMTLRRVLAIGVSPASDIVSGMAAAGGAKTAAATTDRTVATWRRQNNVALPAWRFCG
jgi:hypothetical protein